MGVKFIKIKAQDKKESKILSRSRKAERDKKIKNKT